MSENTTSQASSKAQFEELRGKFEETGSAGKQIDELSERFQKAPPMPKPASKPTCTKLKAEHQAEYEQFQKLQKSRKRLGHAAKAARYHRHRDAFGGGSSSRSGGERALGIAHSEQTDATAQSQAAEPAAPAAPSAPDAGTDSALPRSSKLHRSHSLRRTAFLNASGLPR